MADETTLFDTAQSVQTRLSLRARSGNFERECAGRSTNQGLSEHNEGGASRSVLV